MFFWSPEKFWFLHLRGLLIRPSILLYFFVFRLRRIWHLSREFPEAKKVFFCENYSRFTYLFFTITYLPSYFSPSVFEVLKIIRQAQNQIELEKTVGYRFVSGLGTFLRRATNLCILHLPLAYSSYSLCSRYLYLPSTAVYNMT